MNAKNIRYFPAVALSTLIQIFAAFGLSGTLKGQVQHTSTENLPAPDVTRIQKNYVITDIIKVPGVVKESDITDLTPMQKQTQISYLDGLARPIQRVDMQASPMQKDIVQILSYDAQGRGARQYLPYASTLASGKYRINAKEEQLEFYNQGGSVVVDSKPYSESRYDGSPFDLILEQGAVGSDWQPGTNHSVKHVYRVNVFADSVMRLTQDGPKGFYGEGDLSVREVTDEDGNTILIFSDQNERTVLKKVRLNESVSASGTTLYIKFLETYFIYNDLGRLVYQVAPKAVSQLRNGVIWNHSFINQWIFLYNFDSYGRLIEKKAPGSDVIEVVYDQLNRPVMMQDGGMRAKGKWIFIKYDHAKRPVMQGLFNYTELYSGTGLSPREQLQKYHNELNYNLPGNRFFERRIQGAVHGYSNDVFPQNNCTVLALNYYDDYDFNNDDTADLGYVAPLLPGAETEAHLLVQGKLTGTKKAILGASNWITSAVFYDKQGRILEVRNNNHIKASSDLSDCEAFVYEGFLPAPKGKRVIKKSSSATVTIDNRYEYDHRGRLIEVHQRNNGGVEQEIVRYNYNELGQLIDKKLRRNANGDFLQSVDFRYNIRGWLTGINNGLLLPEPGDEGVADLFGIDVLYNKTVEGLTGTNEVYYSGKISAIRWRTNDVNSISAFPTYPRSYKFTYDEAGRLRDAQYSAFNLGWGKEAGGYDERDIRYDENGNILALKRYYIPNGSTTPVLIDNLNYTYQGDQLKKVTDESGNVDGFADNSDHAEEYTYNKSGSLVSDKNKGNATGSMEISYNDLGKVSRIQLPDGKYIQYTYSATGERVSKEIFNSSGLVKKLDYLGNFIFENGSLSWFSMAEGRIRHSGGVFTYEYIITDHQGNARVSFEEGPNGQARLVQENHYYPFGSNMKGAIIRTSLPGNPNQNLFNGGSELQNDFGDAPNLYSTFFREYDPILGRMNAVDPMVDKYPGYSPYNFSFNDPVNYNDPSGADPHGEWKWPNQPSQIIPPFVFTMTPGEQFWAESMANAGFTELSFQNNPFSPEYGMKNSVSKGMNVEDAAFQFAMRTGNFEAMSLINAQYGFATFPDFSIGNNFYKGGTYLVEGASVYGRAITSYYAYNTAASPEYANSGGATTAGIGGDFLTNNWKDIAFLANDLTQAYIGANTTLKASAGYRLAQTTVQLPLGLATRTSTRVLSAISKVGGAAVKAAPWVATGAIVANVVSSHQVTAGDVYQALVTGASVAPGWGLIVGGGALALEGASYYFTGRSISDNINRQLDGGVIFSWK